MKRDRRRGKPEPVSDVLTELLESLGLTQRMDARDLLIRWPEVVGEKVARFSRAVHIEAGVLTIQADNAVWRQELTLLMPDIIAKYNELCGEGSVREIKWAGRR